MKLRLLLIAFLVMGADSFAQTDPVRDELNHIFQYIDKSQIPTGYLEEYGAELVNKSRFNGVLSDSNFIYHFDIVNFLFNDLESARINPSVAAMASLDTLQKHVTYSRFNSEANLVFFSGDYSSLREDAIQQNLFSYAGNQIFDVYGRTQSPYLQKHVFAAVPNLAQSRFVSI